MTSSTEKYPTIIKIVQMATSVLGGALNLYFVTAITNKFQATELKKVINFISEINLESNKVVLTNLINKDQLKHLHDVYEPRSKEWRGQYYALSKAVVEACKPYI